jgi:fucose 4-O-acetylase-like acetyltransferase
MAKGMAIVLVVLGHTLQGLTSQFDDLPAFRVVYSFHMPLFAFLAGAAATHWLRAIEAPGPLAARAAQAVSRVRRAAVHLLLPFAAWTLVGWWMGARDTHVADYALRVLRQPDVSLWFLPCIFWCTVFAACFALVSGSLLRWLQRRAPRLMAWNGAEASVRLLLFLLLWSMLKSRLPPGFALVFANQFHGGLFLFFALGSALFRGFVTTRSAVVRALPYLLFVLLVPYWHRTLPFDLVADAPALLRSSWIAPRYALVVALCGTLAAVDVVRWIARLRADWLDVSLAYLGQASLAVYAVHFYFLGIWPPVLAPLVLSVAFYALVSRVPGVRVLLLGYTARTPARRPGWQAVNEARAAQRHG